MYQHVSKYVTNLHNLRIKQYVPIGTNMYHQYVINLHNLRMKQYVPRCITICNQSTQLMDETICTNMYHNMYHNM